MKRHVRILGLLVLVGIIASACVPITPAAPAPAAPTAAAQPTAPAQATLKGKRLCITSPVTLEILNIFYDDMRAAAQDSGLGLDITVVDAKGDFAKQLADVEQFIASGDCAAIATVTAVTPEASAAWAKAAQDAKDKGICLVNHSADWVTNATQNLSNPHYPAGYIVGEEAGRWYMAHGAKGEVGTLNAPHSPGLQQRVQGFKDGFKSVVTQDVKIWEADADNSGSAENGAAVAASMLQAHPDIKILFTWGGDSSLGVVQAANEAGHKDPNEFFVGTVEANDASIAAIGKGDTILQAAGWFPYRFSAPAMERAIEWCLLGEKVPPTGYVLPILLKKGNTDEILRAGNHQFLPENAKYFDQYMVYFDTPVKTGDPFPDQKTGHTWKGASTTPGTTTLH
ncbi:MAG TPA: sugar ABC transporter substrate-binding protein [Anaerolineae bacterium]|nr:sugar ABC transporter substrate-binding protein [Anaerolineae bacterium]